MSKLHPVEMVFDMTNRYVLEENRCIRTVAQANKALRLLGWLKGYVAVFRGDAKDYTRPSGATAIGREIQGYRAGRRAAERWLAGCPVRRVQYTDPAACGSYEIDLLEAADGGPELPDPVGDGTYRLERIGD